MIKYLGSKRRLLDLIGDAVRRLAAGPTVLDLFSGTSRVGHALKGRGYRVVANDHNAFAHTLARCYVAADRDSVEGSARQLIDEFNRLPAAPGYFTDTFCVQSRFFQPKNGGRVDAVREAIAAKLLPPDLEAVMLVSLMEAADRVDSTTGVQMAYLKQWAKRSYNPLQLRLPAMLNAAANRRCQAHHLEALEAASTIEADCAYLDPPYNQHSYLGNYHIWESICRWDQPEVYGIACKRIDCKLNKSDYNSKPRSLPALTELISRLRTPNLIVSFSNEGFIDRSAMEHLLMQKGHLQTIELDHKRYVGAQIGIYNPKGHRTGIASHLRNKEYIYIVSVHPLNLAGLDQRQATPGDKSRLVA